MRRGRPTASAPAAKPTPSPMRGTASDPFAALDSNSPPAAIDDISSRFPSLDQFSLLHDGGKFDFDSPKSPPIIPSKDLGTRVTEKLADDAFAVRTSKTPVPTSTAKPSSNVVSRAQKIIASNPELQAVATPPSIVYQPTPTRPTASSYVSQGTMTAPTPPPTNTTPKYGTASAPRFPPSDHHRSASLPRNQDPTSSSRSNFLRPEEKDPVIPRVPSNSRLGHIRHPSSSRPSLEGGRPSADALDPIARTKSSNSRPRPSSTYLESNMDFLREKEKESIGRPSMSEKRPSMSRDSAVVDTDDADTNIDSNVDFLRTMEDHESKKDRRRSSGHASNKSKRSSMPSMSLTGTKNLLAGKFGDAFKRFENNTSAPPGPRTPSPLHDMERRDLTPIAGSEATDGRSDDGNILEDMDSLPPEQRREIERRRLSMEEKRVANAAAEYRKRLADRGPTAPKSIGGVSRATSIQNKVKSLLDENQGPSPKKTAEGYGKYTDTGPRSQGSSFDQPPSSANPYQPPVARKPISTIPPHARTAPPSSTTSSELSYAKPRSQPGASSHLPHHIMTPATASKTGGPRPSAPPKPMHLNSISTGGPNATHPQGSPPKPAHLMQKAKLGNNLEAEISAREKEDYLADFSKRFPSLSGIEMVETDLTKARSEREVVRERLDMAKMIGTPVGIGDRVDESGNRTKMI